ncbi:MAG: hypothetical protein AB7T49_07795 [Oligoflexales bacterium]
MKHVVMAASLLLAQQGYAQDQEVIDESMATAIGTHILLSSGQTDIHEWKEVFAFCLSVPRDDPEPGEPTEPGPGPDGPGQGPDSSGGSSNDPDGPVGPGDRPVEACPLNQWSVMVTTSVSEIPCPNGEPSHVRSGLSVSLQTRDTGAVTGWGESNACPADPTEPGEPVPEPAGR